MAGTFGSRLTSARCHSHRNRFGTVNAKWLPGRDKNFVLKGTQLGKLPGDPTIILFTNVTLGDKKKGFMTALSKAVVASTGKPESYVAVCVQDGLDIIFGGSDGRWALANLTSLGAINKSNNEKYSAAIAELLEEHGVPSDRYYVNCFDVPRENCAYRVASFG